MNGRNIVSYIILGIVLLGIAIPVTAYVSYTTATQMKQTEIITVTPTPTVTVDPTADWKVYDNGVISYKYPSDWTLLDDGVKRDYPNTFAGLRSPSKQNDLLIAPAGYLIFGFSADDAGKMTNEQKTALIKGKQIAYSENTVKTDSGNQYYLHVGLNNSYTYVANNMQDTKSYSVFFGHSYPIGGAIAQFSLGTKFSKDVFDQEKEVVFQILGTIEFKQSL